MAFLRNTALLFLLGAAFARSHAGLPDEAQAFAAAFSGQVDSRYQVELRPEAIAHYRQALLARPEIAALPKPEFVVVVNRHPASQNLAIFLVGPSEAHFVGSTRVSTGVTGRKEHFFTPLGLFENKREYGNYRAQGSRNENGIRGLGPKGSRVFDFGWQASNAGWGKQHEAQIRLQIHGTDPDVLEPRLGTPASKGCVRIHQNVNKFMDENGVLDMHYVSSGNWAVSKNKKPSPYDGRYMLVIDAPPAIP